MQFATLAAFAGPKTNEDVVEWCLSQTEIIATDIEEDPRTTTLKFKMKRNVVGRRGRLSSHSDISDSDSDW